MTRREAIVIGGGVMGLTTARELAGKGLSVLLIEREERIGTRASWAAAGMLAPRREAAVLGNQVELGVESARLYPEFVRSLEEETGIELGYRSMGLVHPLEADEEPEPLPGGEQPERLDADALYERFPSLAPGFEGAAFYPDDHQIDPRRLVAALEGSVRQRGVEVRTGTACRRVVFERGHVVGVETEEGSFEAPVVLNAAGSWADQIENGGLPSGALVPVRGQVVRIRAERELPHVLHAKAAYVVPRDGDWICGSTMERVGHQRGVTVGGLRSILTGVLQLFPDLVDAPVVETWSGLRPGTPDGLPYMGPVPDREGLFVLAGHFRNGILLAPLAGQRMADRIVGGADEKDLAPFAPNRLADYSQGQGAA